MVWVARTLCVSPEGRVFTPGTASFHGRVGYRDPDFDLADYAVRNMGFVLLVLLPTHAARVRCRPKLLTPTAVRRICRELRYREVSGVEIDCVGDGTTPANWSNYRALLRRLRMSSLQQVVERR